MEKLELKIERFLRTGQGSFDALALELFAYQFECNTPYRAFCEAQQRTPSEVKDWLEIPAVPIQAFKGGAPLTTFSCERAAAVFHSSSTTGQTPSQHYLKTLTFYETALKSGFSAWIAPSEKKWPFCLLVPSPGEAPHSSLTWMLDVVMRQFGGAGSGYFIQRGLLDDWRLSRMLARAQTDGHPVVLLGTTLAFLAFFEQCSKQNKTFRLPIGSRLMDTGGMKTQKRDISRTEFVEQVERFFGIPEDACLNEYGMCEMSSQFYACGTSSRMQGPPWVRTQVIDPVTGNAVGPGESGLLRHFDLANVDSVMAIQTEDVGEWRDQGFVLKGRATGAELKGCSLAAEAYFK